MDKETLTKIGLSKQESAIYLVLLKLNLATVRDISKESGLHRTNIYDTLEKLKEKYKIAKKILDLSTPGNS